MTMHLARGLSTINTKKPKQKKLTKAQLEKLQVEWRAYNKRMRQMHCHSAQFDTFDQYLSYLRGEHKPRKQAEEFKTYAQNQPFVRHTEKYPSLQTSDAVPGLCAKRESPQYTGDLIVGIATMHKSNLVPVGRGDDPKEYARMRRG